MRGRDENIMDIKGISCFSLYVAIKMVRPESPIYFPDLE